MNKSHIALGILVAAVIVTAITWVRPTVSSVPDITAAAGGALQRGEVLVVYSDKGFTPGVLKITRGASIRFLNASGKALRIAPQIDPAYSTTAYRGFEASSSIRKGESFQISVTLPGVWGYRNLNDPGSIGVVIVE